MLNVSPDTVLAELESAKVLLEKWLARFDGQLPVVDQPGSEEELEKVLREFCGEMRVVAGKVGNLSDVMLGE